MQVIAEQGDTETVLHAGVPGYSTLDEVAWLRTYGAALQPRTLVLGVFLGNDIQDNGTPDNQRLRSASVTPVRWFSVTRWLYDHSELYDLARRFALRLPSRPRVEGMADEVARAVRPYRDLSDSARRAELVGTAAAVAEFDSVSRALHSTPLVVLIPDAVAAEGSLQIALRRQVPSGVAVDFAYPNQVFSTLLAARGIPCYDLTPVIRAAIAAGDRLYFPMDRHMNAAGNRLVAAQVAALLHKAM